MRQIEVINQETIIDVSAEVTNVEILVSNYDDDLVEKFALEAQLAAQQAEASATAASGSAAEAAQDAIVATNQALLASAARLNAQNAANAAEASEDAAALSAASALSSATSAELDAIATAADRVQTGLDRQATGSDRVQTGLDRIATGADRVQTGLDAQTATTQAGVATTQAGIATTQAGIATTQAGNALTSANNALNSANAAAASAASAAQVGTSTLLTGFATGANTTIAGTDSILGAFQKAQGQINARAVISGTPVASQVAWWGSASALVGVSEFVYNNTEKLLSLTRNANAVNATPLSLINSNTDANTSVSIRFAPTTAATTRFSEIAGVNEGNNQIALAFITGQAGTITEKWRINPAGILQSNGAQTIRTSTGLLSFQNLGGNVAIGSTTDAGFRLDVNGTARVQGALTTNLTAGSVPFIGASGLLTQNNTSLFWDNTNLRLGIGTSSPSSYSYLTSAITAAIGNTAANGIVSILSSATGAGAIAFADGISGSERFIGEIRYDHNTNEMYFRTNGTNAGFINSAGRWLIGPTVTPTNTLDVNGTARIRTLSNATGDFVSTNADGVLARRTPLQSITDMASVISGWNASVRQRLEHTTAGVLEWVNV